MIWNWFKRLVSLKPHFYIGGVNNPYMLRWFIIPRNPWFNIYLHKFLRDDDDRALHDHPWWFLSMMLWGSYTEWRRKEWDFPDPIGFSIIPEKRRFGSIVFRRATACHRVTLNGKSAWTLVFTGRKTREWGFWCPKGFIHWKEFVARNDEGNIGKGCNQ